MVDECWRDEVGVEDFCIGNPRARWSETSDEWGSADPIFWTLWSSGWVCPENWCSKRKVNGAVVREWPEPPAWLVKCRNEMPRSFVYEVIHPRRREKYGDDIMISW